MTTPRAEITVVAESPNMVRGYEEGDKDNVVHLCIIYTSQRVGVSIKSMVARLGVGLVFCT